MTQEYKVYVTGVELGKEVLDRAMKTSKRFGLFVEAQMRDKRCERQTLAALLMGPVQHIMRYALLLTGVFALYRAGPWYIAWSSVSLAIQTPTRPHAHTHMPHTHSRTRTHMHMHSTRARYCISTHTR